MDRRQDQIVLVEQRHAGLVAGGVGRIERQFGQEPLARGIAAGNLLELDQVGAARLGILVDALQMRLVPAAGRAPARPASRHWRTHAATSVDEAVAIRRRRAAAPEASASAASGSAAASHVVQHALRRGRARRPGISCITRKPATRSRGFSTKRNSASTSLTWAASRNFEPAELHERDIAAGQFDLQRAAMAGGAEQHRLLLQQRAALAILQDPLDDVARLVGLVADA